MILLYTILLTKSTINVRQIITFILQTYNIKNNVIHHMLFIKSTISFCAFLVVVLISILYIVCGSSVIV